MNCYLFTQLKPLPIKKANSTKSRNEAMHIYLVFFSKDFPVALIFFPSFTSFRSLPSHLPAFCCTSTTVSGAVLQNKMSKNDKINQRKKGCIACFDPDNFRDLLYAAAPHSCINTAEGTAGNFASWLPCQRKCSM